MVWNYFKYVIGYIKDICPGYEDVKHYAPIGSIEMLSSCILFYLVYSMFYWIYDINLKYQSTMFYASNYDFKADRMYNTDTHINISQYYEHVDAVNTYNVNGTVNGLKTIFDSFKIDNLTVHDSTTAIGTLQITEFKSSNIDRDIEQTMSPDKEIILSLQIQSGPLYLDTIHANFSFLLSPNQYVFDILQSDTSQNQSEFDSDDWEFNHDDNTNFGMKIEKGMIDDLIFGVSLNSDTRISKLSKLEKLELTNQSFDLTL